MGVALSKRRRKKRPPRATRAARGRRLRVELVRLDVLAEYDGGLRGYAEPTLLLGAYWARVTGEGADAAPSGAVACLGTLRRDLEVRREPPLFIDERGPGIDVREHEIDRGVLLLLLIAWERDGGLDVGDVALALADPSRWHVWRDQALVPDPRSLDEVARELPSPPPSAETVQLLLDGATPADRATGDEWIAAGLVRIAVDPLRQTSEWRFELRSPDGRNAWLARIDVRLD